MQVGRGRWILVVALVIAIWCVPPSRVTAMSFHFWGLNSNLLVVNKKVYFAQSDGSLTVLSLHSGRVLRRVPFSDADYPLRLYRAGRWLVSNHYGGSALLEPVTLEVLWRISKGRLIVPEAASLPGGLRAGDVLLSAGDRLIRAHRVKDGRVVWSHKYGTENVIVGKRHVLLHKDREGGKRDIVTLIERKSGRKIWQKKAPADRNYDRVYLGGSSVYVRTGPASSFKSRLGIDRLLVWDLTGKQTAVHHLGANASKRWSGGGFSFGDKFFLASRVLSKRKNRFPVVDRLGRGVSQSQRAGIRRTVVFRTQSASITATQAERGRIHLIVKTKRSKWRGESLYFRERAGRFRYMAEADGLLLMGSNRGHVECVDLGKGMSRWIYYFPVKRLSSGLLSSRPYLLESLRAYRGRGRRAAAKGTHFSHHSVKHRPKLVMDPSPLGPFWSIGQHILLYFAMGLFFLLAFALLYWKAERVWQLHLAFWLGLLLAAGGFVTHMTFLYLSIVSDIVGKSCVLAMICANTIFAFRLLQLDYRTVSFLYYVIIAVAALLTMPLLLFF